PNMGMPVTVTHRVVPKPDRRFPCVSDDFPLLLEKAVLPRCCQNQKEPLEPKILEACCACFSSPIPPPLGHGDLVSAQNLFVGNKRVLLLGDRPGHVEPV